MNGLIEWCNNGPNRFWPSEELKASEAERDKMSIGKIIKFDKIECGNWFVSPNSFGLSQIGLAVKSQASEKRALICAPSSYKIITLNEFDYVYPLENVEITIDAKSLNNNIKRIDGAIAVSSNGAFISCDIYGHPGYVRINDGLVLRPEENKIIFSTWALIQNKLSSYDTIMAVNIYPTE